MPFTFQTTKLDGVIIVTPKVFPDPRGFFIELFKTSEFQNSNIPGVFKQINFAHSNKGIVRGLHYQIPPFEQGKLVKCVRGKIFDVAVDIRKHSSTFGRWTGFNLSESNNKMVYIPPGYAHGFYTLSDNTNVMYLLTNEYSPEYERGIIWNDPQLHIQWPDGEKNLSERDKDFPKLMEAEVFP